MLKKKNFRFAKINEQTLQIKTKQDKIIFLQLLTSALSLVHSYLFPFSTSFLLSSELASKVIQIFLRFQVHHSTVIVPHHPGFSIDKAFSLRYFRREQNKLYLGLIWVRLDCGILFNVFFWLGPKL